MSKEKLHIFFDKNAAEIKASLTDSEGSYFSTSAWQDILKSLNSNKTFNRTCSHDGMIVEYTDLIVQIDDWKSCMNNPAVNGYIRNNLVIQQSNRLNKIKEYDIEIEKQKVKHDEELIPLSLQEALKKRHEQLSTISSKENLTNASSNVKTNKLTIKRTNKYIGLILSIAAGTLVVSLLSIPTMSIHAKTKYEEPVKPIPVITATIEPQTINEEQLNNDFNLDLNINDLLNYNNNLDNEISFKYEDRSQTDKAIETKIKYGDLIEKYAKKCGIDPKIVLGIATQESGNHDLGLRFGSKGGLMQIEVSYWKGKEITYYDFDDKKSYIIKIDDNVNDIENNILIGCAILQNELKIFNYNIPLAIQSYNEGYSNMNKILDETSAKTGLTKTNIINNDNCLEWLNYTNVVNAGDPNYVNNVLSWTGYGYSFYEFTCQKENGDLKVCTTIPITNDTVKTM